MKISKNSEGIGWEKENNVSIDGENIDLTSYAKKTDLPTKTSQLTNDSGFLTNADIDGNDVLNRLENVENSMNKVISDNNIKVELQGGLTVYPYEFESENDGYIEIELQGNTKILDDNGNEISSGNINATLVSSSEVNVNVNGKSKIVKYYNNEGILTTLNNLCKFDDYVNTIERHDDGKYYYHERCVKINLGSVNIVYPQKDQNQVEGFYTCYVTPNQVKELQYVIPNSVILCDKLQCLGAWYESRTLQEELVAIHASSSMCIRLSNDKATNVDEALSWLQENNPCIIAKLNEERVYECVSLDSNIFKGTNELNIVYNGIMPNVTYTVKNSMENVVKLINTKINTIDNDDINSKLNLLNNLNYIYSNRTILLSDLEQDTDISSIINEALMLENVDRVVLPVGWYNIGSTIDIPAGKILKLQGDYHLYNMSTFDISDSRKKETVLTLTKDNIAMIKMHNNSTLEGGYLKLNIKNNCQAIRLDFWEEAHSNTKVKGTKINGKRTYNQTAVLMECDPNDGITKNGYGVYCDFDIAISTVNIGYHLHRHNATWQDGPGDIVWMTECYFRGSITHCNRYIWFDTIGGWGGDSSKIEASIQCGTIVGEDYPGIEFDCSGVRITGTLWDFGGNGLQQKAMKLNTKCFNNFILGLNNKKCVEDLGKNNIFFSDFIKEEININDIVSPKINSFIGNQERFNYTITVNYLDGTQQIINNIYTLPYDIENGYFVNGIYNLECLFESNNNTNTSIKFTQINYTLVDNIKIEFNFSTYVSLFNAGLIVSEVYMPENITIEVENRNKQTINIFNKTFIESDTNYISNGIFIYNIDLLKQYSEQKNNLIPKQKNIKKLKYTISGYIENSRNTEKKVKIKNLIANIEGVNPNFNNRYLYDFNNFMVKNQIGENLFGSELLNIDFSKTSSIDGIFGNNANINLEIINGQLNVTNLINENNYLYFNSNVRGVTIIDLEYNFNTVGALYYANRNAFYNQMNGRKLIINNNSDAVLLFTRTLQDGEYVRINKIVSYSKTNNNIYWPEIVDKFTNYYI